MSGKGGAGGASTPEEDAESAAPTMASPDATGTADTMATPLSGDSGPGSTEGADSIVGETLGERYRVTQRIGKGGMGAVYEATHVKIGKRVAIKVLLDKYQEREQVVARLEQEARLASSIGNEHIIDITDFGQTVDGRTFVAMEYLDGESLGQLVARKGRLDPTRALSIARQIASALGAAHEKGIVHRDVKPDNVFLIKRKGRDFVKVVDFGISKSLLPTDEDGESPRLTQTGMVLGTPLYMSPEQASGEEDLDHRIDVYALGVILYEMITGEVPFTGKNYLSVLSRVISETPIPPAERAPISEDLEAVILKAMAKDRGQRYPDMAALDQDLAILQEEDPRATSSGLSLTAMRRRRPRSRLRTLWALTGISLMLAAGILSVSLIIGGNGNGESVKRALVPVAPVVPDAAPIAAKSGDAAPARAPVQIAKFELRTTPAGAAIYAADGSRFLGTTPFEYQHEKVEGKVKLIAELEGYDDTAFELSPLVDDGRPVEIRLKKPKKGKARRKLVKKPKKTPAKSEKPPVKDETAGGDLMRNPYGN